MERSGLNRPCVIPAYSSSNGSPVLRDRLQVQPFLEQQKSVGCAALEVRPRRLSQLTSALLHNSIFVQPQSVTALDDRSKNEIPTDYFCILFFVPGLLKKCSVQPGHAWKSFIAL